MNINVRVTTSHKGSAEKWLADFEKRMKGPHAVKVGFPGGKTDADVVTYATYNHFGTAGRTPRRGGWGGPIPARPFITVALFRHRREIRLKLRELYRAVLAGRIDARVGLGRLGLYGVGIIQDTIRRGLPPANAELTIKLKGTGKNTLNNEGRMLGSVTWAFDESAGNFVPGRKRVKAVRRKR